MWREGYVPGGDTRFWVRAMGHGDDVVMLLHGWPQDGSMWERAAPTLVEAGYRVVAPDLKGFGRSDAPTEGYDPETLGDEISQLIRNLHARKAVVVGHDWGGAVALATAFRHPGMVRAVVVASSPFRQLDLRRSWHIPLMNLPLLPQVAFRRAARPLVKGALRYASAVDGAFSPDAVDRYAAAVRARPEAWLEYYRTLSRRALVDWALRQARKRVAALGSPSRPNPLRVPALVVWGSDDRATPAHLAPRVAHDLGAELVVIPGAGHFVPDEAPAAFVEAVLAFLDRAESGDLRTGGAQGRGA